MLNQSLSDVVFNQLKNESRITDVEFINDDQTAIGARYGDYNINVAIRDNVTYEIELGDAFYARFKNHSRFIKFLDFLHVNKFDSIKNANICDNLRTFLKTQGYIHFKDQRQAYITNLDNEKVAFIRFFDDCVKIYSMYRGVECYKNTHMAKAAIYSLFAQRNPSDFDDLVAEDFFKKAYGPYLDYRYSRTYELYNIDGLFRAKIRFEDGKAVIGIDEYTSLANFMQRVHNTTFG